MKLFEAYANWFKMSDEVRHLFRDPGNSRRSFVVAYLPPLELLWGAGQDGQPTRLWVHAPYLNAL